MLVEKKGRLAVWVGSIPKKAQFNAYLKETYGDADDDTPISPFCADMGDSFYDHDFVFGEWSGARSKPVAKLLDGWNHAHTFSAGALKLAKKAGIEQGNTLLIAYDHELKPARWPDKSPVRFLGNLPYSDEPPPLPEQDLASIHEHKAVNRMCFAPDGQTLASGGSDGTLMAWDAKTGRALTAPQYAFQGALVDIYTLMFSADGRRCLAATLAATCVWEQFPAAKKFSKPLEHFAAKAISADGQIAFGCELKRVTAHNLADGKPVKGIHRALEGYDFALLPASRIATTGHETSELIVWNTKNGKRLFSLDSPVVAREIAAAPSGNWAVTYGGTHAVLWNLEQRSASKPLDLGAEIRDVLVPTDDLWIALPRSGPLQVRSLRTGKLLQTLGAAKASYWRVYAGGTTVAAITSDRSNLEAWNAKSGKPFGRYPDRPKAKSQELIDASAVSPDGKTIALGLRSGEVRFLQCQPGKLAPRSKK